MSTYLCGGMAVGKCVYPYKQIGLKRKLLISQIKVKSKSDLAVGEDNSAWSEDISLENLKGVCPVRAGDLQDGHRSGELSFGFSAGGLLFPYFVGVCEELEHLGVMRRGTNLAGCSAGSLIAACFNAGLDMQIVLEGARYISDNCRQHGTRARLRYVLHEVLDDLMPDDLAQRISGNTHIGVTKVFPYSRFKFISQFKSRDDAIEALLTSCHVPLWFSGSVVNKFRGEYYYDGGVSNFIPMPPNTDEDNGVRITCFPIRSLKQSFSNLEIAPGEFARCPYSFQQMLQMAFQPPLREDLYTLARMGRRDARTWAQQMGLTNSIRMATESHFQGVDQILNV
eukprot:TRINITY_DN2218_c3_g1_i1.p2 TRINITY_DN2218_c3_g1~~TRINITY_DN2218_c3_g1_i1.p2  ORF type:complete len:339 (+),score=52.65 TRINITY_DN2218_c3_g1_i1:94-1110(+)